MNIQRKNKGFTLVELIVVLVILAILAAIMVPALLGYIDRARESQDVLKANNFLKATQTVLANYYAYEKDPKDNRKNDYDVTTNFAKKVRETAGDDPYMVIIGIGDGRDADTTEHDKYTAYFVAYWESVDKDPLFYNGSEWSTSYPWPKGQSGQANNFFYANGTKKCLTFVFVANKTNKSNVWNYLQTTIDTRKKGFATANSTQK